VQPVPAFHNPIACIISGMLTSATDIFQRFMKASLFKYQNESGDMEKTEFEQEYGIDLDSPDVNVVKAVEVGIAIEKRGEDFYFGHAERLQSMNPELAEFLKFLGNQEVLHHGMLTELKKSLQEKKQWMEPDEKLREPEIFSKGNPAVKEGSDDLEILMEALKVEKDTRDYYRKFSEEIGESEGKQFFKALADFEQTHVDMIDGIIEARAETHIET
jgi:rubrerythrin